MEVKGAHFGVGLIGRPVFERHSVGGDHYTGAVGAETAVNEDLLIWIIAQRFKEGSHFLVAGTRKWIGGNIHVAHAKGLNG